LKRVPVKKAVGMVLEHDITRVVPGQFKGRALSRGHVIRKEDIPCLLDLGKEHLYVLDLGKDELHEDEASMRIARALAGPGLGLSKPSEGKVNISVKGRGLLKVDSGALREINSLGDLAVATRHTHTALDNGDCAAGVRTIPLVVSEKLVRAVETIAGDAYPVLQVKPFCSFKVGVVVTGSEVFKGRVPDGFGPVVEKKLSMFGSRVIEKTIVPDKKEAIVRALRRLIQKGAEMLIATGGMSVDPDDKTPGAIKKLGAEIVSYGMPVLPGSMMLMAYLGDIPVLGLPACVMHARTTALDLCLPRIHAGERITREDMAGLGHGGLCLGCETCRFPACSFGRN